MNNNEHTAMNSQNDRDQTEGTSSDSQKPQEREPASKLRDLKPEKDPMGGAGTTARQPNPGS